MWGIYPASILHKNEEVSGTVWEMTSEAHLFRLAEYETSVCAWCECDIELIEDGTLHKCPTFCWDGDPDSKELED